MAWNVLVSYLKDQKECPDSSSSFSGDSEDSGSSVRRRSSSSSKFLAFLSVDQGCTPRFGGSTESLQASSPSPSPRMTRSGSIRVCDSPLHRGSSLGSPAFRRKKMRAKSEYHLAEPGSEAESLGSVNRRSHLPVPKAKGHGAKSSTTPGTNASPRSSMYKDTLLLNQKQHSGSHNRLSTSLSKRAATASTTSLASTSSSVASSPRQKRKGESSPKSRLPNQNDVREQKRIRSACSSPQRAATVNSRSQTHQTCEKPSATPSTKAATRIPTTVPGVCSSNNNPLGPARDPVKPVKPGRQQQLLKPGSVATRSSLNKSTPSLHVASIAPPTAPLRVKKLAAASRPRPRSRDLSQRPKAKDNSLHSLAPLAPKAKFRSDGEISICDTSPGQSGGSSSIKRSTPSLQRPRRTPSSATTTTSQARAHRLSNDIQCWPWTSEQSQQGGNQRKQIEADLKSATTSTSSHVAPTSSASTNSRPKLQRKNSFFKVRSRSLTFFQRLHGGLRSSFRSTSRFGSLANRQVLSATIDNNNINDTGNRSIRSRPNDQDWVFFRGFSGKRREELVDSVIEPYAIFNPSQSRLTVGLDAPRAPPRRRQRPARPLSRALSFTDAHFIAQAMYEGDPGLIADLYPDFPRAEPIYAKVDLGSKRARAHQRQSHPSWRPNNNGGSGDSSGTSVIERNLDGRAELDNNWKKRDKGANSLVHAAAGRGRTSRLTPIPGGSSEGEGAAPAAKSTAARVVAAALVVDRGSSPIPSLTQPQSSSGGDTKTKIQHHPTHSSHFFPRENVKLPLAPSGSAAASSCDGVTFSTPVMFVKQASDLQPRRELPDLMSIKSSNAASSHSTSSSPSRKVTKVSLDFDATPPRMEPPPVISPWNNQRPHGRPGSTSSNESSSGHSSASGTEQSDVMWQAQARLHPPVRPMHPFTQRAQYQYAQRQRQRQQERQLQQQQQPQPTHLINNGVAITSSKHGCVTLSPNSLSSGFEVSTFGTERSAFSLDDSFRKILAKADNSISQAESILSSLVESGEINKPTDPSSNSNGHVSDSDSDPASLGSDIETNIRRLEKTQAKINAALETFRNVQALNSNSSNTKSLPHSAQPHRSNSYQIHTPFSHEPEGVKARTAPAKLRHTMSLDAEARTSGHEMTPIHGNDVSGTRSRKTSLFRRHSFTSNKDNQGNRVSASSSSPTDNSTSAWYEGDVESNRSSNFDDAGSFSDSENGFLPFKTRIRGLLGSFGKGKNKKMPPQKRREIVKVSASVNDIKTIEAKTNEDTTSSNPMLKATLGEFTRQIEILSSVSDRESDASSLRPQFSKQVKSQHSPQESGACHGAKSVILRSKLAKNDSIDTNSNRNSIISGQSMSSESFEDDTREVRSSPRSSAHDELTPEQREEKKVYYIAREILTSERVFVDILKLLNVEFREFVQKARRESKSGILPDTDFSRLFSNLPELQTLNEDLLQDFEDRIAKWDKLKKIADVIVKKGPFLKLYTTYIREFSNVNYHFDECCNKYPKFAKLVQDFEKRERCRHLKLKHFMLKPVQRLPQYKLLLEDYLKHLHPDSPDFDDTTNALRIVSEAAEHANDTIKQGDQFRKMLKLQSRLGDAELIRPGRELVKEGELQKISRKGVGPRYFILLSDSLLYCTYTGSWAGDSTSLRVSYRIPLTELQVRAPNAEEYDTEFDITSPVRSCTLRANTVSERNEWLEAMSSAIEEHISRKATFQAASNKGGSEAEGFNDVGKIGNSAPVWVPDRRVTMCQSCSVEFSVLIRRHHCRACGKVICAQCSGNKAPLRYRDFESARVCDSCFEFLEQDLGRLPNLKSRFKKRDSSKNGRYVPQRLKVSANGEGAQMCGYLKRRMKNSKWKRMWFVLKDNVIYAYKASEDTVASDTFPILGYDLETLSERNFELYEGEYAGLVFVLSHPGSETLVFCADNDNVCEKWITALADAVKLDCVTL